MAIAIAIVTTGLTLGLSPSRAHAEGAFRTVLVIDASSSMKRTDPNDLRKVAAELYVDLARRGDRIAVTGFDENVRQSTNGFIGITGPDRRARLKKAIRAIGNDGKWTDFTAGLEEARRLLEGSPERPGEESLVVFLTDGRCEPDPAGAMAAEAQAKTRTARTELCKERTLNQLATSLGGARVYAIGLSKGAPAPFLEELGRRTGGQGQVTLDPKALPSLFAGVYARLLGSRLEESDVKERASFEVYEGARAIDVMLVGRTEKSGVLRDPSGAEIPIDNREPERVYFAASTEYRFYKIGAPKPGTWTVEMAGAARLRLATLQHFDLELSLVDPPQAIELGQTLEVRGRLASAGEDGTPGTTPPADFLDRHTMYALIGEEDAAVKQEMTRGDDGTFSVTYTPKSLGSIPIGLWLEPKSGGVLTRAAPTLGQVEVIPPVYVRAAAVTFGPIKHRESGASTLDLAGSEHAVPLSLSLALAAPDGAPAEVADALAYITLIPSAVEVPLPAPADDESADRKAFTTALEVEVADHAPGGKHEFALTITPTAPAGFEERAITVPFVVEVVPLTFWERYHTWIVRSAIGLLVVIVLLGFIVPARFKKRAILYYADVRDPDMVRRSSYPLGARARRGFYRAARVALGPSGPVKRGGSVTLWARSGGGIDVAPASDGARIFRVDLSSADGDDGDLESALVTDLEPDERPRVTVNKEGRFRMSSGVGYEVEGAGFVFWYK